MAARRHELVGRRKRGPNRPNGQEEASSIASGLDDGWSKRRYSKIAGGGGAVVPGKGWHPCLLAAAPARVNARS